MKTVEIVITNVLPTGTSFAVCTDDMSRVFINSTVAQRGNIQVGDTVFADVIPNFTHPERTPWQAMRIIPASAAPSPTPKKDRLTIAIERLLSSADYPASELAAELHEDEEIVQEALGAMQTAGRVRAYYVYELIGVAE